VNSEILCLFFIETDSKKNPYKMIYAELSTFKDTMCQLDITTVKPALM